MAYGIATNQIGTQAASAPREHTQLESHLYDLRNLHDELGKAAARAMQVADRLLGSEPSNISPQQTGVKEAIEPSLLVELGAASTQARDLAQQIHYQLNRLERL